MPATSDLKALQEELEELKRMSLARSKKAGEDMKAIKESMRRMMEREKGKAKALDKIKRECTCIRSNTRPGESLISTDDSSSSDLHTLRALTRFQTSWNNNLVIDICCHNIGVPHRLFVAGSLSYAFVGWR